MTINRDKAYEFSKEIVKDISAQRNEEIYPKMSEVTRKGMSNEELIKTIELMNVHFGKIREANFESESVSYFKFPDGTEKPARMVSYLAETDKAEIGKVVLQVWVVAENENLKCAQVKVIDDDSTKLK